MGIKKNTRTHTSTSRSSVSLPEGGNFKGRTNVSPSLVHHERVPRSHHTPCTSHLTIIIALWAWHRGTSCICCSEQHCSALWDFISTAGHVLGHQCTFRLTKYCTM
ncbi:hypothetical protein PDJAM_G00143510 [Pangasius djambal]|uniref:Uncharacterized protein n=1 Tax=Pangasius djambal TaxID=1691987 RepID=A0ACC5ZF01_9TELE|nr:hypothetical protein [Pangasius djambal]